MIQLAAEPPDLQGLCTSLAAAESNWLGLDEVSCHMQPLQSVQAHALHMLLSAAFRIGSNSEYHSLCGTVQEWVGKKG